MNTNELMKYIGHQSMTLNDAMKMIDRNSAGLIYIVDDEQRLTGSLTDGDIRRWILKNGSLHEKVGRVMNQKPICLPTDSRDYAAELMRKESIRSVALVDREQVIQDIVFLNKDTDPDRKRNDLKDISIVIMAGGKGTRLYPYTKILPKPLIPIGDIPILERIINQFHDYGGMDFYITLNYRKEMIKSYFSEFDHPYRVHFVEESVPLGTAGSIRLINDPFSSPIIVTNCDILIEADYGEILAFHNKEKNDMTIVSSLKSTVIPYGVLHTEKHGKVVEIEEKPVLSSFINTGMYLLKPEYVSWIPEQNMFHMTDLAKEMIEKGKKVGIYPIRENSFLDMGQFEEMKKMEERMNNGYAR